jgi:hypothetical protein
VKHLLGALTRGRAPLAASRWYNGAMTPNDDGRDAPGAGGALGSQTQRSQHHDSFDHEYGRWRDEQAQAMDRDYASWRSQRFGRDFGEWRAIRAAQAGLRTGSGPPITHADRERELRGADGKPLAR